MARKRQHPNLPTFDELLIPTIQALLQLGGSGTIEEINSNVYEIAEITDAILQIPHGEDGAVNEVDYRLAWSRTYLKKYGLLENSSRGIWALSKADIDINTLNPDEIKRTVREQARPSEQKTKTETTEKEVEKEVKEEIEKTKNGNNSYSIHFTVSPIQHLKDLHKEY